MPRPPMPPGPPTPAGHSGPGGGAPPIPGTPPKDDDKQRSIPESLSGYGFDKAAVRRLIEQYFRVYEERDALPGFDRALLVAFYVLADKEQIEKHLPRLQEELTELDPQIQAMLREEGGETLIVVTRRPKEAREAPSHLPTILAVLTLISLTVAGSIIWTYYAGEHRLQAILQPDSLINGLLTFTLPLVVFFLAQETARRLVARRHGIRLRPSLLIPVPPILIPVSIATFGSITNPKNPAPSRKALWDTAVAGPVTGFVTAVLIVIIGLGLTLTTGIATPDEVELEFTMNAPSERTWREGEEGVFDPFRRSVPEDPYSAHNITIDFRVETAGRGYGHEGWQAVILVHGAGRDGVNHTFTWQALGTGDEVLTQDSVHGSSEQAGNITIGFDIPPETRALAATLEYRVGDRTSVPLGEPLAFQALSRVITDDRDNLLLHPTGLAGWTALFITGVMLLPVGRFDGGGIARALVGDRMTILGYASLVALAILTLFYAGWVYLLLIIILFLSVRHPVPLDDTTPLDTRRRLFTLLLVAILVLSFVPLPSPLEGLGFLR